VAKFSPKMELRNTHTSAQTPTRVNKHFTFMIFDMFCHWNYWL